MAATSRPNETSEPKTIGDLLSRIEKLIEPLHEQTKPAPQATLAVSSSDPEEEKRLVGQKMEKWGKETLLILASQMAKYFGPHYLTITLPTDIDIDFKSFSPLFSSAVQAEEESEALGDLIQDIQESPTGDEHEFLLVKQMKECIKAITNRLLIPLQKSQWVSQWSVQQQIIELAAKKFTAGTEIRKEFKRAISHPALTDKVQKSHVTCQSDANPQFQDNCFVAYNANIIPGTNFIAAAGPQRASDVAEFFHSLVFNSQLPPVQEVIALGQNMHRFYHPSYKTDFLNYFAALTEEEAQTIYTPKTPQNETPRYQIQVNAPESKDAIRLSSNGKYFLNLSNGVSDRFVESKITVKYVHPIESAPTTLPQTEEKALELRVTFHEISDNNYFRLDIVSDKYKEIFWQHYQKSLQGPVVIHCSAGIGRTGHVILMLELLRHFETIFTKDNPAASAQEILTVLARIRQTRPSLIFTQQQFTTAIRNAIVLRNYALEKGYSFGQYNQVLQATSIPDWRSLLPTAQLKKPTLLTITSMLSTLVRPVEKTQNTKDIINDPPSETILPNDTSPTSVTALSFLANAEVKKEESSKNVKEAPGSSLDLGTSLISSLHR